MDIDSDTLGIPDTDYDARVTLPSNEFTRIVRDLSQLGESVRIEVSKEGVRFASEGEAANGSVLLRQTEGATSGGSSSKKAKTKKMKAEGEEEDEDEEAEEGEDAEEARAKKISVKKEKEGDGDVEMNGDDEGDEDEFKPKSDDQGEDEQDNDDDNQDDEEGSSKKRKKKVGSLIPLLSTSLPTYSFPLRQSSSSKPAKKLKTSKSRKGKKKLSDDEGDSDDDFTGVRIEMNAHVSLTFSLKYLVNFSKSSSLCGKVQLMMSNDVPLLVSANAHFLPLSDGNPNVRYHTNLVRDISGIISPQRSATTSFSFILS